MRVSDSHRLLFVHVQKTGGRTMETLLDELVPDVRRRTGEKHTPLRRILRQEPELADYWIVGFVRNPWARMVSWWSMIRDVHERADQGDAEAQRQLGVIGFWRSVGRYADFDTFIERGPEEFGRLRRPQIGFLSTRSRQADYIGHTETLEDDVRKILAQLGLPCPASVPHVNQSPSSGASYRPFYSAASRDRVAQLFRRDVEAFGYEF